MQRLNATNDFHVLLKFDILEHFTYRTSTTTDFDLSWIAKVGQDITSDCNLPWPKVAGYSANYLRANRPLLVETLPVQKVMVTCLIWRFPRYCPCMLLEICAPCKVIQESLGFRIPLCGFRIPCLWIPDSITNNLDSGLQSWLDSGSDYLDSGFHTPKLPGFRILDYLTWGDLLCITMVPFQFQLLSYSL